jgi:hypothetical protein
MIIGVFAVPQMDENPSSIAEESGVSETAEYFDQVDLDVKQPSIERTSNYQRDIEEDFSERPAFLEHTSLVEVHQPAWEETISEKKSYASIVSLFILALL